MKLKTSIDQWPPFQARDFLLFSLNHPALLFGSRGTDVDLLSSGFELTLRDLVANDSVETVLSTFCLSFDFSVLRLIVPKRVSVPTLIQAISIATYQFDNINTITVLQK